jgi:hypothetical protein
MSYVTLSKALAVSCAIAAAAACNSSNRSNVDANTDANGTAVRNTVDTRREEPRPQPIDVTGCLQQGSGHTYILTRLNEPSQKLVGTTGTPAAVEREQLREAANAYRIDPQGDVKLDDMVGKQIRVAGTLTDRADLPKPEASNVPTTGASGAAASNDGSRNSNRADVTQGDLAKIDATSATVVNASCGDHAKKAKRASHKK